MCGMEVIYGTTNESKVSSMRKWLAPLDINIIGLIETNCPRLHIEESGHLPLENAVIKARAYYSYFKKPVFSCDSGLFIEGLPSERQPGVHVRRVEGRELSDEEMIDYYASLIKSLGGSARACYRNAVCYIDGGGYLHTYDGEDIGYEDFLMITEPHPKRKPGFPLDSLSVDIASGRYYYDLEDEGSSMDGTMVQCFRDFFVRCGIRRRKGADQGRDSQ